MRKGLFDRIEAALRAADTMADLARELNDGPDSTPLASSLREWFHISVRRLPAKKG